MNLPAKADLNTLLKHLMSGRLIGATYNSGAKLQPKIGKCRMVNNATYIHIEATYTQSKKYAEIAVFRRLGYTSPMNDYLND